MNCCPNCGSSNPHLHPAVQHEGEVQICQHSFHKRAKMEPREVSMWDFIEQNEKLKNEVFSLKMKIEQQAQLINDMNEYIRTFALEWIAFRYAKKAEPREELIDAAWALCDCVGINKKKEKVT